jgi:hypothetical protein
MTLALRAVRGSDGTGGFKLKIPYVDWELGGKVKISREQTQVITVELTPAPPSKVDADFMPLDIPLAEAVLEVARLVAKGKGHGLALAEASVELECVFTESGEVTLLEFSGKHEEAVTHTLTLKLKAS